MFTGQPNFSNASILRTFGLLTPPNEGSGTQTEWRPKSMTNGLTDGWTDWGVGARDACASNKLFIVCRHVGRHVHLHVSHHVGHRDVTSTLCEV